MHPKKFLPHKTCLVCNRPFSWRKKWERDWEEVRYCSAKCRNSKKMSASATGGSPLPTEKTRA